LSHCGPRAGREEGTRAGRRLDGCSGVRRRAAVPRHGRSTDRGGFAWAEGSDVGGVGVVDDVDTALQQVGDGVDALAVDPDLEVQVRTG